MALRKSYAAYLASIAVGASLVTGCSVNTDAAESSGEAPETLNVAAYLQYPPFRYLDEAGQPAGIEVDLINEIAATSGREVVLHGVPWESLVPGISNGRYDFAIGQSVARPESVNEVDFLQWTMHKVAVIVRTGNPDNIDPANLCGLTFGAMSSSSERDTVVRTSENCVAEGQAPIEILSFPDQADMTQALMTGQTQAQLLEPAVAKYLADTNGNVIEVLPGTVAEHEEKPLGWIFPEGDQVFLPVIAEGIETLKESGRWQELLTSAGYPEDQIIDLMVDDAPYEER